MRTQAKTGLITLMILTAALTAATGVVFAWFFREVPLSGTGLGIVSDMPDFFFKVDQYEDGGFREMWTQGSDGEYMSLLTVAEGFDFLGSNPETIFRFTFVNKKKIAVFGSIFYYLGAAPQPVNGYTDVMSGEILAFRVSGGYGPADAGAGLSSDIVWSERRAFSTGTEDNPNYIAGQGSTEDGSVTAQFFLNTNVSVPPASDGDGALEPGEVSFYVKVDYYEPGMWNVLKENSGVLSPLRAVCPLVFRGYATTGPVSATEGTP